SCSPGKTNRRSRPPLPARTGDRTDRLSGCRADRFRARPGRSRGRIGGGALQAPAVESDDLEGVEIHAVQAANVHRDHVPSLPILSSGEGTNAADLAEVMVDDLLAELIVAERIASREHLERVGGDEDEERSGPRADRAVAGHHRPQGEVDLVADRAAVAGTLVGLGFARHFLLPVSAQSTPRPARGTRRNANGFCY